MLFNSLSFLLFFPVVCIVYYAIPTLRLRNLLLLAASYYFYMCWEPVYALLLLTCTLTTYGAALLMAQKKTRLALTTGIVVNLLMLFFFKYFNFAAESVSAAMEMIGVRMHVPRLRVLLPVGISFYIFQALGYLIDVSRGNVKAERDLLTYALFVSFFPQLVAGPIERSTNLLRQFYQKHTFSGEEAVNGLHLMLWGFFLKLVLADRCAIYADTIFNNLEYHNGSSILMAVFLFSFQIYGDFAGYSCIAIGCARVMGFRLLANFRQPFLASSISELWHRWHISLSSWMKDYVYIPLGGSRFGHWRTYRNLMLTFLLSGLWHGACWTYIVWGSIHGLLLCIERWLVTVQRTRRTQKGCRLGRVALTFTLFTLTLVVFRSDSLSTACTAFTHIFTDSGHLPFVEGAATHLLYASVAIAIVTVVDILTECGRLHVQSSMAGLICSSIALLVVILSIGVFDGGQFIYFQF